MITNKELITTLQRRHALDEKSVIGVKSLSSSMTLKEGLVDATISSDAVDSQQEVLLPKGMIANDFLSHGTVFWNHDYSTPIGKPLSLKATSDGKSVRSTFKFADRPDDATGDMWDHLDWVKSMVAQSVIKGISVGFISLERRLPTKADSKNFGKDVQLIHSKWKLLEYSVTPIPVNTTALINYAKSHQGDKRIIEIAKELSIDLNPPPRKVKSIIHKLEMPIDQLVIKSIEREVLKEMGVLWR